MGRRKSEPPMPLPPLWLGILIMQISWSHDEMEVTHAKTRMHELSPQGQQPESERQEEGNSLYCTEHSEYNSTSSG